MLGIGITEQGLGSRYPRGEGKNPMGIITKWN